MIKTMQSLSALELPMEYVVVGEHRRDAGRLLLKGDDGGYYEYRIRSSEVIPVIPDYEWTVESETLPDLDLYVA